MPGKVDVHIFVASIYQNDPAVIQREIKRFYDGVIGIDSSNLSSFELSLILKEKEIHSGVMGDCIVIAYKK